MVTHVEFLASIKRKTVVESSEDVDKLELADFLYELPQELIAQHPNPNREDSRLLYLDRRSGEIKHHCFKEIVDILRAGDLLLVNDTKVIPARVYAQRSSGGIIELLLLKPLARAPHLWQAMGSPLRKLKKGERLRVKLDGNVEMAIDIVDIVLSPEGQKRLVIDLGTERSVFATLSLIGKAPLPPYIKRAVGQTSEERVGDLSSYQTVFAKTPGAVAAPTAGLHFSEPLLAKLKEIGVLLNSLTLHVGPGTFKPITSSVAEHTVEPEWYSVSEETASAVNKARAEGRRIIAVGTTACRAIEAAGKSGTVRAVAGEETNLYIKPGFEFRILSGLITNFHLSGSSLLVLASTFAGHENLMNAYREAIKNSYRFYSYGDAMLII